MVISRTAIFLIFLLALNTQAQTYISGGEVAGTWKTDGNPYVVTNTITINSNDRLKIEPGVHVEFDANCTILVYGNLEAYGSENDSILFTSSDTTGFTSGNYQGWLGLAFLGQGTVQAQPSSLEYCIVQYSKGSGITCMHYDNLEITHSHFRNNLNYGISLMEYSDVDIANIKVSNNHAGGIDIQYSAPNIENFEVADNGACGISVKGTTLFNLPVKLRNGSIHNNLNTANGGALSLSMEARMEMNSVDMYQNSAINGGAIFCSNESLNASQVILSENMADNGGGIFSTNDAIVNTNHFLLHDNHASYSGGAVYVTDAEFIMLSGTISNNTAAISGGGFFFDLIDNKPNYLSNSIIWQNYPDEIYSSVNAPKLDFCDVLGGFTGAYNIDADPLFVDAEKANYELSWTNYPVDDESKSPCIDAGNFHFDNDPDGTLADMGAFYYHQSATITATESKSVRKRFSLYPNPATSSFTFDGIGDVEQISIFNMAGQTVRVFQAMELHGSCDINNLEPGIYVVQIKQTNGGVESTQLIKN